MKIVVIGAGKMGTPLACQLAHRGATVMLCDIRQDVVAEINRGECPIDEPGVPELLRSLVADGKLAASTDTEAAVAAAEIVIVIVPVLLTPDRTADLSVIESVSRQIAAGLKRGAMVVYETTLPIGTTRRLAAILGTGGLAAGRDFDLVFSPERVKSQLVLAHLSNNAKIVGGLTPAAGKRAAEFYATYLGAPTVDVGSLEAAEMVKLAGMVYRDVNIALANEVARYCEAVGVDLFRILPAINSDGEAAMLQPGIGVGGHCTPVYPYFLLQDPEARRMDMRLTKAARAINDEQAAWCIARAIEEAPAAGSDALILGLGFRPEVKEHVCSTSFLIADALRQRGARPLLHDPLYSDAELRSHGFEPIALERAALPSLVVLSTAHKSYRDIDFSDWATRGVRTVIDGRALWEPARVRDAGLRYIGVGRP